MAGAPLGDLRDVGTVGTPRYWGTQRNVANTKKVVLPARMVVLPKNMMAWVYLRNIGWTWNLTAKYVGFTWFNHQKKKRRELD